tara:strand:+ start:3624 stop:4016 length:393 start_codon:yes stop_codon:yes gene_type:complete
MARLGRGSTLGHFFLCDNLYSISKVNLNNSQSSPNAISHKALNSFLNKALKEDPSIDSSENHSIKENNELNDLITSWSETSQKLLLLLSKEEKILTKNRSPKSLMAFGAMGAHINMALQALKSSDFTNED